MKDQAISVLALLTSEQRQRASFLAHKNFNYTELQGVSACNKAEMAAEAMLEDVLDKFDELFGACETPQESSYGGAR